MVKAYFKYSYSGQLGGICSNGGIIEDQLSYHFIDQYVNVINIKTQEVIKTIYIDQKNINITCIAILGQILAIGYQDGEIILYDKEHEEVKCRLLNHQSGVTQLLFLNNQHLISGSQDTSLIVWDIVEENLLLRLMGHSNQITGLQSIKIEDGKLGINQEYVISSSKDGLVKIWDINLQESKAVISSLHSEVTAIAIHSNYIIICTNSEEILVKEIQVQSGQVIIVDTGVFKRQNYARVLQAVIIEQRLFILNNEKKIEIYKIKQGKSKKNPESTYQIGFVNLLQYADKISNISYIIQKQLIKLFLYTLSNCIIISNIGQDNKEVSQSIISEIKGSIKQLALTNNDSKLFGISAKKSFVYDVNENQKIQEFSNNSEIHSICILPKNKFYLIGDASGTISLIDVNKNENIFDTKIHIGAINNIQIHENSKAFNGLVILTTEIEKKLNFLELFYSKQRGSIELAIVKTIYMKENIRNAMFSTNGDYYALSLYNNLIHIYYCDSHNIYLELYGHSLPVLSFDFTTDDTIIISGGIDKSIKLWATDFGNCKKTLKAHQAEIIQIKTVKETHYFFSASKDNLIKYWDGDTYQMVMQFNENLQQITSLAVGCIGDLFYTGTKNGVIRKYIQTKEQVFVSEEEDKRMQEQLIEEIQQKSKQQTTLSNNEEQVVQDLRLQQISQSKFYEVEQLMDMLERIQKYREAQELGDEQRDFENENPTEQLFKLMDQSQVVQLLKFLHHKHYKILINEMSQEIAYKRFPNTLTTIINYMNNKYDGYGIDSHENLMKLLKIKEQLEIHYKKQLKIIGFNMDIAQMILEELEQEDDQYIFE